jgi:FtsP/CotA-like multicopper oxidase with cupredoxin domain
MPTARPASPRTRFAPGDSYLYEFTPPDAGTFFFHSHAGMQLDCGLYAPLIVEAADETLDYDREAVLVLDDWLDGVRGTPEAQLETLRASGMEMHGMAGRGPAPAQPFGPVRGRRATSGVFMANLALAGGLDAGDVDYPLHLINGRPPEARFQHRDRPGPARGGHHGRTVNAPRAGRRGALDAALARLLRASRGLL